jgi:hypothetical protein
MFFIESVTNRIVAAIDNDGRAVVYITRTGHGDDHVCIPAQQLRAFVCNTNAGSKHLPAGCLYTLDKKSVVETTILAPGGFSETFDDQELHLALNRLAGVLEEKAPGWLAAARA